MGLEEFNMLFSCMRATGLLPHSIVLSRNGFRFVRFDVGWRYAMTWWYGIVVSAQFIWTPYAGVRILSQWINKMEPGIYLAVALVWQINYLFVRMTPPFFVFSANSLKSVWKILGKVDYALKNAPQSKPSAFKNRILGGLMLATLAVYFHVITN